MEVAMQSLLGEPKSYQKTGRGRQGWTGRPVSAGAILGCRDSEFYLFRATPIGGAVNGTH